MSSRLNVLLRASNSIKFSKTLISKSRSEFESISINPRSYTEEHEDLTPADYVNEIFDEEYYHFFHKDIQDHHDTDHFNEQRIWYHWYLNNEEILEKYQYGSGFVKWTYLTMPLLAFFYIFYVKPHTNKRVFGKYDPRLRPIML